MGMGWLLEGNLKSYRRGRADLPLWYNVREEKIISKYNKQKIDHREYSYQFTLSIYVESFIKWEHSHIMLVDISYQNTLI